MNLTSAAKRTLLAVFATSMVSQTSVAVGIDARQAPPIPAAPAPCETDMSFSRWLDGVLKEASAKGISSATLQAAIPSLIYDKSIVARDQNQGVFQQNFLKFSDRMASAERMKKGAQLILANRELFDRIEAKYGVPAQVLVTFWGLESDFSANTGKFSVLRAVTTLAYDCRRAAYFRGQLLDALRILEKKDLAPRDLIGSWAGELSGVQFTPSDYFNFAVDFDGDGRRDMLQSVPDMLASAANMLVTKLNWRRGEPWIQEVRVPANLPWEKADLEVQLPRSQWVRWGVTAANGSLPNDNLPATLLLPMGRLGPAFLAYPNFRAFLGWNASYTYATTAAYFATRIPVQGIVTAPALGRGNRTVISLEPPQLTEVQNILISKGYLSPGSADGKLGGATRAAVRQAQLAMGIPADAYPSLEFLQQLRR